MHEIQLSSYGLDRPESGDDVVPRSPSNGSTAGQGGPASGRRSMLILTRHNYPAPVARLLGEAVVLAALIGSSLKFQGKFILQTQTDGPVNLIVVDLDAPDGLRGYARFDADAVMTAIERGETSPAQLLGKGHLAMTVDQGVHMERYQGIVALDGGTLEDVAHAYFQQSEQIRRWCALPWRSIRCAATASRTGAPVGRSSSSCRRTACRPCPTCPVTAISTIPKRLTRSMSRTTTGRRPGLCSPPSPTTNSPIRTSGRTAAVPSVPRNRRPRLRARACLKERCTCSAARIEAMLRDNFTAEDRAEMLVDGEIEVICEFCSADYHFKPQEFGDHAENEH